MRGFSWQAALLIGQVLLSASRAAAQHAEKVDIVWATPGCGCCFVLENEV